MQSYGPVVYLRFLKYLHYLMTKLVYTWLIGGDGAKKFIKMLNSGTTNNF